jgi:hypothetical protein
MRIIFLTNTPVGGPGLAGPNDRRQGGAGKPADDPPEGLPPRHRGRQGAGDLVEQLVLVHPSILLST